VGNGATYAHIFDQAYASYARRSAVVHGRLKKAITEKEITEIGDLWRRAAFTMLSSSSVVNVAGLDREIIAHTVGEAAGHSAP
jgi:hypothetical protein